MSVAPQADRAAQGPFFGQKPCPAALAQRYKGAAPCSSTASLCSWPCAALSSGIQGVVLSCIERTAAAGRA